MATSSDNLEVCRIFLIVKSGDYNTLLASFMSIASKRISKDEFSRMFRQCLPPTGLPQRLGNCYISYIQCVGVLTQAQVSHTLEVQIRHVYYS